MRPSQLSLAYKFSTWPQKKRPQLLTKAPHLAVLFESARETMDELAKGKGKKKPFYVVLESQNSVAKGKKDEKKVKEKVCTLFALPYRSCHAE